MTTPTQSPDTEQSDMAQSVLSKDRKLELIDKLISDLKDMLAIVDQLSDRRPCPAPRDTPPKTE